VTFLLTHREHLGVPRSQLCFAFAQALHDLRRDVRMASREELGKPLFGVEEVEVGSSSLTGTWVALVE
jgi:hypothetical protein